MAKVKITLVKSTIGCQGTQKRSVKALGLGKIGSSVIKEDTPSVMGNVNKVKHLLSVEELQV